MPGRKAPFPATYLRSKFNDAYSKFPRAQGKRFIYRRMDDCGVYLIDIYDGCGRRGHVAFPAVAAEIFHDGRSIDV